jgi:HEAT repeat protein
MAIDKVDVISALRPDEPNYPVVARQLGNDAAPILAELAEADDVELAAKAASLARFLTGDSARGVLQRATAHRDPVVRGAAAASLGSQPELVDALMGQLLTDSDVGVRKLALGSLQVLKPRGWRDKVDALASNEQVPALQELARRVVQQLP